MDMKLSGTRIKELRLRLSWSQEKLAEEAGLNARTVQRAESEGSASLRTRLQLATALGVQPEALDAEVPAAHVARVIAAQPTTAGIHYVAVLLLVSLVFLAVQPMYFSLSTTSFDWIGSVTGREGHGPRYHVVDWMLTTLGAWALVSVPMLHYFRRRHRALLLPYAAALLATAALAMLRGWHPEWVVNWLATLMSIAPFALLASLYVPRMPMSLLRHGVGMCLIAYVFIWFAQDLALFALSVYVNARDYGVDVSNRTLPLWYVGGTVLKNLGDLVQLIPPLLVLMLALGERQVLPWPSRPTQAMPEPPVTP